MDHRFSPDQKFLIISHQQLFFRKDEETKTNERSDAKGPRLASAYMRDRSADRNVGATSLSDLRLRQVRPNDSR
jgi:hypothetical protein